MDSDADAAVTREQDFAPEPSLMGLIMSRAQPQSHPIDAIDQA